MMKIFRNASLVMLLGVLGAAWCGCGRDVRLAGKRIRHVEVKEASHYGVSLDKSSTPEQVAFVALRAIREDFFAPDPKAREAALDIQFDVAAADIIAARNRTSLGRNEYVHHVVTAWTPAVAHYAGSFESDSQKAIAKFKNRGPSKSSGGEAAECELAMEVADPSNDPAASVVMLIRLAKDGGFWRVLNFGFEPRRSLATAGASAGQSPGS